MLAAPPLAVARKGVRAAVARFGLAGGVPLPRFERDRASRRSLGGLTPAACFLAVSGVLLFGELADVDRGLRLLVEAALCAGGAALVVHGLFGRGRSELLADEVRQETQLLQSQRLEAIGRLSGGVAHDFNNILTAIGGYSELIRKSSSDPDVTRWVDGTAVAIERAAALTRQLLAFSRQQVMERRVVDLNEVVASNEMLLQRVIREDIAFHVSVDASAGRINADPAQLGQVLINLAANARDAMPRGGILELRTGRAVFGPGAHVDGVAIPAGEYARLTVADDGEGMSSEVAQRIFEPFFTTKEALGGTGLGLATAYGIVKQSGGFIFVASVPGSGTTFDIYLPATDDLPEQVQPDTPAAPAPAPGGLVLLVEDEEVVRRLLAEALTSAGYEVLIASDGASGLELARRHGARIELLVTDLVLPGASGRLVAEALREASPAARVIFMSGYAQDVLDDVLESGIAFLQKPFPLAALQAKAAELLAA